MCDREVVTSRVLLLPVFDGGILPQGFTGRQGAAGEGTGQAQMSGACEAKLKASMQTAGEPGSLRAGDTTANLCDAFATSIFKKEDGKKSFKSSEPFLIFKLCEKEYCPLGTRLNSGVFLRGKQHKGRCQWWIPVADQFAAGAHMAIVPCSSHVRMDRGAVLQCCAIDK